MDALQNIIMETARTGSSSSLIILNNTQITIFIVLRCCRFAVIPPKYFFRYLFYRFNTKASVVEMISKCLAWATILLGPSQNVEITMLFGIGTCFRIPWTTVLTTPLQHIQVTVRSGTCTRLGIPWTTIGTTPF
jgi:hypothetical protein